MPRLLVSVVVVSSMLATTGGCKKSTPSLELGDLAPALKASKWLQGEEISKFGHGKVYIIEFWATWCGPCVMIMPHVGRLQAEYKQRGVRVIGYSARDEKNTDEQVAAFVKQRGHRLPYTFAYADDRTTYDAWMTAAGQKGIPCSFVVDKTGRIAYIGHPLYLGVVVPKVLAGNISPQALKHEVEKMDDELHAVANALNGPDAPRGLKALRDFETKYPPLANNPYWLRERFRALVKAGQAQEAKKLAEAMIAEASKEQDSDTLFLVSAYLRDEGNRNKQIQLAVRAAEAMVNADGDNDARSLINLASTYFDAGDKAKAKDYAQRAVQASGGESAETRQRIERQAMELRGAEKDGKK